MEQLKAQIPARVRLHPPGVRLSSPQTLALRLNGQAAFSSVTDTGCRRTGRKDLYLFSQNLSSSQEAPVL